MKRNHRTRILVTIISELFAIAAMAFTGVATPVNLQQETTEPTANEYVISAADADSEIVFSHRRTGDPNAERRRRGYLRRRGSNRCAWNLPDPEALQTPVFRSVARLHGAILDLLPPSPDDRLPALRGPPLFFS